MRKLAIAAAFAALVGCKKALPPSPGAPPAEAASEGEVVELSEANFEEKTAKGVVLVDFWGPRCPPCRTQGPIVEEVAKDFAGRAVVCKLNVEEALSLAREFGIEGIPTLIVFKDGQESSRMVGLKRKEALAAELEKALGR